MTSPDSSMSFEEQKRIRQREGTQIMEKTKKIVTMMMPMIPPRRASSWSTRRRSFSIAVPCLLGFCMTMNVLLYISPEVVFALVSSNRNVKLSRSSQTTVMSSSSIRLAATLPTASTAETDDDDDENTVTASSSVATLPPQAQVQPKRAQQRQSKDKTKRKTTQKTKSSPSGPRGSMSKAVDNKPKSKQQQQQQQQPKQKQQPQPQQQKAKRKKQHKAKPKRPWKANYHASRKTQDRIQKTFEDVMMMMTTTTTTTTMKTKSHHSQCTSMSPTQRAKRVLDTLLATSPHLCNPANIVASLTYSVKAMGNAYIDEPDLELRQTLYRVLDILNQLLVVGESDSGGGDDGRDQHDDDTNNNSKPRSLSKAAQHPLKPRQLCNVIWAIAKHVDRDPGLLPAVQRSSNKDVGNEFLDVDGTKVWELCESQDEEEMVQTNSDTPQRRLDETIDEIAYQLTHMLREEQEEAHLQQQRQRQKHQVPLDEANKDAHDKGNDKQPILSTTKTSITTQFKVGEICMACWAYGKLRPRTTPPGWCAPPQTGLVSKESVSSSAIDDDRTLIKLERQWGSRRRLLGQDGQRNEGVFDSERPLTVTDELYDAIGTFLCKRSHDLNNAKESAGHDFSQSGSRLEDCRWSELANIGWAFASHGRCQSVESEQVLNHLADVTAKRLTMDGTIANNNNPRLLVRDIAQILWSLGTLQADNFRVADGLSRVVDALTCNLQLGTHPKSSFAQSRPLRRWCCADLVQVAVALAHARIDEMFLLQSIYEEGAHRLIEGPSSAPSVSSISDVAGNNRHAFHPWEVSILLWAQARLSLTGSQGIMFDEFVADAPSYFIQALQESGGSFEKARIGSQEQANIAWSLVVLEKYQSPEAIGFLNSIFVDAAQSCKSTGTVQLEHAHQLWQAYFILQDECPGAVAKVPDWFAQYLKNRWTQEKARDKLSSARHKQLSSTLQLMGVDHINESDEDIDVAIILKPNAVWVHQTDSTDDDQDIEAFYTPEEKVSLAVEFDGPNHFTRLGQRNERESTGPPEQPRALGHTVLKYRLLKKQGWTVVRIPYYEFDRIPFWASMERQRYLQRKLRTHANIEFSQVDVSEYKALTPNRESRFD